MFQHILLPTDGSELSKKAINGGLELAKASRARHGLCLPGGVSIHPVQRDRGRGAAGVQGPHRKPGQAVSQGSGKPATAAGVTFDTDMSTFAVPYLGIIDAAERHGCDVIFMASHGRRGLSGLLLGSETQKVLTHTDIPVIVYR